MEILAGLLLPLAGTTLGSACVFFVKRKLEDDLQRALTGFVAGVMVAASIWSLILPALEQSEDMGKWSFVPAVSGFWLGIIVLLVFDRLLKGISRVSCEEDLSDHHKVIMMVLAVTLHNLPEGMAVGAVFAGWVTHNMQISLAGALLLTVGIAIQNFPEGAIISLPLHAEGMGKGKAFLLGVLSGVIEPIGGICTLCAAEFFSALLPYCLSFAAGAMFFVVLETLEHENIDNAEKKIRTIMFSVGFTLMMVLDVAMKF